MYLHLGQDTVVRQQDIIGIFDIETASVSKNTRDFLSKAQKSGQVYNVTDDLPKSFIICCRCKDKNDVKVYISQISSTTLLKRSALMEDSDEL